jgi:hypothetical protein
MCHLGPYICSIIALSYWLTQGRVFQLKIHRSSRDIAIWDVFIALKSVVLVSTVE